MKINIKRLLTNIDTEMELLTLVTDKGTIKIQTLMAALLIARNIIKNSLEDEKDETI